MKQHLALVLALLMALCLFAGCGDRVSEEEALKADQIAAGLATPAAQTPTPSPRPTEAAAQVTAAPQTGEEKADGTPSTESLEKTEGMPEGDKAEGVPEGDKSAGMPTGESGFDELTLADGTVVTDVVLTYDGSVADDGSRSFSVVYTVGGQEKSFTGTENMGVYTADGGDAGAQAVADAFAQALAGAKADGMPMGEKTDGMPSDMAPPDAA